LLIEAKGTTDRYSIRMALGQLLDYRRFLSQPRCALLLPVKPREDLLNLIREAKVDIYWKSSSTFVSFKS